VNLDEYQDLKDAHLRGCVFCEPSPILLLAKTALFGICFDVVPLVKGHLIIHSFDHTPCGGELPPETFEELAAVRKSVRRLLEAHYGPVIMYEHGRAGHCVTQGPEHRLCHHFHLHCMPVAIDLSKPLRRRFEQVPVARYEDLPELYDRYGDYLFFENTQQDMFLYPVEHEIEPHLLRTAVAEQVGNPHLADWRAASSSEDLAATMRRLRAAGVGLPEITLTHIQDGEEDDK
jgi:diadenosine tetraphosphate (Ap4A) HIT family hydrolase